MSLFLIWYKFKFQNIANAIFSEFIKHPLIFVLWILVAFFSILLCIAFFSEMSVFDKDKNILSYRLFFAYGVLAGLFSGWRGCVAYIDITTGPLFRFLDSKKTYWQWGIARSLGVLCLYISPIIILMYFTEVTQVKHAFVMVFGYMLAIPAPLYMFQKCLNKKPFFKRFLSAKQKKKWLLKPMACWQAAYRGDYGVSPIFCMLLTSVFLFLPLIFYALMMKNGVLFAVLSAVFSGILYMTALKRIADYHLFSTPMAVEYRVFLTILTHWPVKIFIVAYAFNFIVMLAFLPTALPAFLVLFLCAFSICLYFSMFLCRYRDRYGFSLKILMIRESVILVLAALVMPALAGGYILCRSLNLYYKGREVSCVW